MLPDEGFIEREIELELGIQAAVCVAQEPAGPPELTLGELARFKRLAGGPRRDSWLRGRKALKKLLVRLGVRPDTAGISFPNPRFSLTHSGDFAVAVGADDPGVARGADCPGVAVGAGLHRPRLRGIGVDLELGRFPAPRSASFFLTDGERRHVDRLPPVQQSETLLRLWTIKEALFKANPSNRMTWFTHYALEAPDLRTGSAAVAAGPEEGRTPGLRFTSLRVQSGYLAFAICLGTCQP